jgi:hypothetical protein
MVFQLPKKAFPPRRGGSLVDRLGLKLDRRHTMVLPMLPDLLDWFEGQFSNAIRRTSGETVSDDELEPFVHGRSDETTILIQVTGYPALEKLDPADAIKIADSRVLRTAHHVVGLSSHPSDTLVYGALSALSQKEDGYRRPFATYPCKNGDLLWATELREGELFVLVDIKMSPGSRMDRGLEVLSASRRQA